MAGARRCPYLRFNPKLHYVDELEFVVHLLFIELCLFVTSVGLVVTSAAGNLRFPCGGRAESQPLGLCRFSRISVAYLARSFLWMCLQSAATGCSTATPPTRTSTSAISPAVVLTAPKITLEEGEDSLHQEVVEASACDGYHGKSSTGVTRCRLLRVSYWRNASST